jgi:hypothetical protein
MVEESKIFHAAREHFGTIDAREICARIGVEYMVSDLPEPVKAVSIEVNSKKMILVNSSLSQSYQNGHALCKLLRRRFVELLPSDGLNESSRACVLIGYCGKYCICAALKNTILYHQAVLCLTYIYAV